MEYTLSTILTELSSMSDEKRKEFNRKQGVNDNQYGIPLGKFRPLAKKIKKNNPLAFQLWNTNNYEAMILASMIFDPELLTETDFETLIKSAYMHVLVDELTLRTLGESPLAKKYMHQWMIQEDETYGRAGWNLAICLVQEDKLTNEELEFLLSDIVQNLKNAVPRKQEAMNRCLCEIGIRYDEYTARCISLGEQIGVYKDLKVSKGCTSSYAPTWITVVRANRMKMKK
jgi:3-methyladenine DNA glycosylase AlkD